MSASTVIHKQHAYLIHQSLLSGACIICSILDVSPGAPRPHDRVREVQWSHPCSAKLSPDVGPGPWLPGILKDILCRSMLH